MLTKLLQDNEDLFHRLSLLEHRPPDTASSHATIWNRTSIDSTNSRIRVFEFELDLRRSTVYRKARRSSYDASFRSSIAASHAWTALTHVSLSEISAVSVMALPLPVSSSELQNFHHYPENTSEKTPLLTPNAPFPDPGESHTVVTSVGEISAKRNQTTSTDQSDNDGRTAQAEYVATQSQSTLWDGLNREIDIKHAVEHRDLDQVYLSCK